MLLSEVAGRAQSREPGERRGGSASATRASASKRQFFMKIQKNGFVPVFPPFLCEARLTLWNSPIHPKLNQNKQKHKPWDTLLSEAAQANGGTQITRCLASHGVQKWAGGRRSRCRRPWVDCWREQLGNSRADARGQRRFLRGNCWRHWAYSYFQMRQLRRGDGERVCERMDGSPRPPPVATYVRVFLFKRRVPVDHVLDVYTWLLSGAFAVISESALVACGSKKRSTGEVIVEVPLGSNKLLLRT